MTRFLLLMILAASLACSTSRPKSQAAVSSPAEVSKTSSAPSTSIDQSRLEKTTNRLKNEIQELESLEERAYYKSIKGDPVLLKQLQQKISRYGSVDTLEANLRALDELRAQNH